MRRAEGHTLLLLSAADDCENLTSALRLARLRCAVWRHLGLGLGLGLGLWLGFEFGLGLGLGPVFSLSGRRKLVSATRQD